MANIIQGQGCSSAKLMLVGEAPGAQEDLLGYPFAGPTGDLINQALEFGGITRSEVYCTNVVKVRPPNNDLKKLPLIGYTVDSFKEDLWKEIYDINPNCILAIGNLALETLTGNKGINHYRGSILNSINSHHKVVATLHPASLFHETGAGETSAYKELSWIKFDTARAIKQSAFPEIVLPQRDLHIARHSLDVYKFLDKNKAKNLVSIDVETYKTFVQCIALSFDKSEAISIPIFTKDIVRHDLGYIWKILYEFLNDTKIVTIAQNAKFDEKRCRQIGLTWGKPCWLSMDMAWHILFPEFPKKLEFIASILTDEPYYKDEGKEYNPKVHSIDRWYLYNAKDAAVEYECAEKILQELKDRNLYDFFFEKIQPLYKVYYDIEDTGILIDQRVRDKLKLKYSKMWSEKQKELVDLIADGHEETAQLFKDFNVNSNGPTNQVAKLIFGYLKLPLRKDTSDKTLKALANNVAKSQRIKDILFHILEIRKIRKTISTYLNAELSNGEPWLI